MGAGSAVYIPRWSIKEMELFGITERQARTRTEKWEMGTTTVTVAKAKGLGVDLFYGIVKLNDGYVIYHIP